MAPEGVERVDAGEGETTDHFEAVVTEAGPRVRQVLVAAFGLEVGTEAAADTMAFAWTHRDRVLAADSPVGFLVGVGRNMARAEARRRRKVVFPAPTAAHEPRVEPALVEALEGLSSQQRTVVMLLHCFEWSYSEVADGLGVSKATVQRHAERGMAKLRRRLGVER